MSCLEVPKVYPQEVGAFLKFHSPELEILSTSTLSIYLIVLMLRIELTKRDIAIDRTQKNRLIKLHWYLTLTVQII